MRESAVPGGGRPGRGARTRAPWRRAAARRPSADTHDAAPKVNTVCSTSRSEEATVRRQVAAYLATNALDDAVRRAPGGGVENLDAVAAHGFLADARALPVENEHHAHAALVLVSRQLLHEARHAPRTSAAACRRLSSGQEKNHAVAVHEEVFTLAGRPRRKKRTDGYSAAGAAGSGAGAAASTGGTSMSGSAMVITFSGGTSEAGGRRGTGLGGLGRGGGLLLGRGLLGRGGPWRPGVGFALTATSFAASLRCK